jgi:hypothetical protein
MKIQSVCNVPVAVLLVLALLLGGLGVSCTSPAPVPTTPPPTLTIAPSPTSTPVPAPSPTPAPTTVKPPTQVSVSNLSANRAAPFTTLTLTGSGFDKDADVRVKFTGKNGFDVTIMADNVQATSLTATVPAYFDLGNDVFGAGTVGVQVLQKSGKDTLGSNVIDGLQIDNLPVPPQPTGAATLAYLDGIIQLLQDSRSHLKTLDGLSKGSLSSQKLIDSLTRLEADYAKVKAQVQAVLKDTSKPVVLAKGQNTSMTLDADVISVTDRLIGGLSQGMSSASTVKTVSTASVPGRIDQSRAIIQPVAWKSGMSGSSPRVSLADGQPAEQKQPWNIHGEYLSDAVAKLTAASDFAGTVVAIADSINKAKYHNAAVDKGLTVPRNVVGLAWIGLTSVPATTALYNDLSAATAATGKEAWTKGAKATYRYALKVGPSLVDTFMFDGVPILGTFDYLANLLLGPIPDTEAGILLNEANVANLARAAAVDSGRLPDKSGLDLVYVQPGTRPDPPKDLVATWKGSGVAYDCCTDDGTRLARVNWDVTVVITSQEAGALEGTINMDPVKIEILNREYYEPIAKTGPLSFGNGMVSGQSVSFFRDGKRWSLTSSSDLKTMKGAFQGFGPGRWCDSTEAFSFTRQK